jgi:tetratricopeptide (TPR) repeat protein
MAGYLEEAEQALQLALEEFKARAQKDSVQVALLTLAALALRADRLQEAERFINEALYYTIDLERDEALASRAAKRMGVAFRMIESPRRALHYLERARELARAAGNRDDEGWALSALGTANAQFGHTRKAVDYHRQALALFRQQGAHAFENEQVLRLAGALAVAGQFAEAMKTLEHLQQLTLARGELIPSAQAGVSLGIVALLQGDAEGYLEGLHEALELVPEGEGRIRERIQRAIAVEPHTKA